MSEQPAPVPNDHPGVWDLVIVDMKARDQLGRERYGTKLQPHNGRHQLRDAYEESLDKTVYLKAAMVIHDQIQDKLIDLLQFVSDRSELTPVATAYVMSGLEDVVLAMESL